MKSWPRPQNSTFPQQVHLSDLLAILRRREKVIIWFFLLVVSLVIIASFSSQSVYMATARIIIEPPSPPVSSMSGTAASGTENPEYYQTQYNLLQNREIARQVINKLGLLEKLQPQDPAGHAVISLASISADTSVAASDDSYPQGIDYPVVEKYLQNLIILPIQGTRLIDISFMSPEPELAARVADAHAYSFIEENIKLQHSASQQRLDWLTNQIQDQQAKVEASQRASYDYRKENDIILLEERQNIISQKLLELNTALTHAKEARIAKQAIYEQVQAIGSNLSANRTGGLEKGTTTNRAAAYSQAGNNENSSLQSTAEYTGKEKLGRRFYIQGKMVNVREGPADDFPIVVQLGIGTEVVEQFRRKDWVNVHVPTTRQTGWVHSSLLHFPKGSVDYDDLFSLPEIAQDEIIQVLRRQLIELKGLREEMDVRYNSKYPKAVELDLRVEQLTRETDAEVNRVKNMIKNELDRAVAVENSTRKALENQKKETISLHEKIIKYDILKRKAESDQNIYDTLLKQSKEINLASVFDSNNIRVIERAEIPLAPYKPNILLNILVAVVLSLFLGTGLAFFVEYMDNTVKNVEDIQHHLGLPVLGEIPYEKSLHKRHTPALPAPKSPPNHGKRSHPYPPYYDNVAIRLPTQLRFDHLGASGQILLVESATMGEGKTTALGNLGVSLGKAGFRVLLVDCDLERPALHHLFEVERRGGWVVAMNRVLSKNIDSGTLTECNVSDLFALIGLKRYSGRLTVTNQGQTKRAFFQNGRLFHLESPDPPLENRLGRMLVGGGSLTETQLEDALKRNRRTGQPLGYILINAGYIKQNQLQGPLKLQLEEHLHTMFSWKQGSFSFEHNDVELYDDERVCFGEDYLPIIKRLSRVVGGRLLENEIISQIKHTDKTNVHLLLGGMENQDATAVNSTLLATFLDLARTRYDVILIDTPPLLTSSIAAPLHALADGVVLVVKSGHVRVKTLNEAGTRLAEYEAKVMGVVLNQTKNTVNQA